MKAFFYSYDFQNLKLNCQELKVSEVNNSYVYFSDDYDFETNLFNLFLDGRVMFTFKKLNKTQENKLESQIETELLKKIGVIR